MTRRADRPLVSTHWGSYRARVEGGRLLSLDPFERDGDPSPIGRSMPEAVHSPLRIRRPMIRQGWLKRGSRPDSRQRGGEPFVEVGWDEALDMAAGELRRVAAEHGNQAIYAGSYGWASAGRFHHAQSQLHRFLNLIGGYTGSRHTYSYAAGEIILPHVIGSTSGLTNGHTSWESIAADGRLVVMFGGMPGRNAQVHPGGTGGHRTRDAMRTARAAGVRFVQVSPVRDDAPEELDADWIAIRPNTDTALMLALAHVLLEEGLEDRAFLGRCTVGFERFAEYVRGGVDGQPKSPDWAEAICKVEAGRIRALARDMAAGRCLIAVAWALQRADHGEQPFWMAVTLAAMLGQIGLAGGGFGFGYSSIDAAGRPDLPFAWPALSKGAPGVEGFIPVARISDMLLNPGGDYDFNGRRMTYPDVRLVYWAGGNPFHHHQDLHRLIAAWKRPETVIVHEPWWNALARRADIVLPCTTPLERNDIGCASRDTFVIAMRQAVPPQGEARSDFDICAGLARRFGVEQDFTEGRDEMGWLRHLYAVIVQRAAEFAIDMPDFDSFWQAGYVELPTAAPSSVLLSRFREDPQAAPLATPSGRIEVFSKTIAGFGYPDAPGHAAWIEPTEWLGSPAAERFPLHLLTCQPSTRLHSQYDLGCVSRAGKIAGREPIRLSPADAAARGIRSGDLVRVFNDRGECLAGAVVSDDLVAGVAQLATGAWLDLADSGRPGALEKHGNPNVLTPDRGASTLSQAPSANSCLVEIVRWEGPVPPVTAFEPPEIIA